MMNFKSLTAADFTTIRPFFADNPYQLSIYSPSSLVAWSNECHRACFTIVNHTLLVSGEGVDSPQERHLILPIMATPPRSAKALHGLARGLGFDRFWYVPGDFLATLDRDEVDRYFTLEEQSGYGDYVYHTEDLIQLKGNKFAKKRNLIHQFARDYLSRNRVSVEPIQAENVEDCLSFLERWCERRNCDVDQERDLACEKQALITTLENLDLFSAQGILIRIDGDLSALGIVTPLNVTTATLNYEKAFAEIKGLYQYLDNECAKRLFGGYRYINKESDLNISNLAESKQSYHPAFKIQSFALVLR